jgi:hypothetical protein
MESEEILATAASQQARVQTIQARARRRLLGAALDLAPKTYITSSILEEHASRMQPRRAHTRGLRNHHLRTNHDFDNNDDTATQSGASRGASRSSRSPTHGSSSRGNSRGFSSTAFGQLRADLVAAISPVERARAALRIRIFKTRAVANELLEAKHQGGGRGSHDISFYAPLHLSGPVALAAEMKHLDGGRAIAAMHRAGAAQGDQRSIIALADAKATAAHFTAQMEVHTSHAPLTALEGSKTLDAILPIAIRHTALRLAPIRVGKVSLARSFASPHTAALVRCVVWLAHVRLLSEREKARLRRFEERAEGKGLSLGEATDAATLEQHEESTQADILADTMDGVAVGEEAALAKFATMSAAADAIPLALPLERRAYAAAEVSSTSSIEHAAALDAALTPSPTTLAATSAIVAAASRVYAALLSAMRLDAAEQAHFASGAPLRRRDRLRREAVDAVERETMEAAIRKMESLDAFPPPPSPSTHSFLPADLPPFSQLVVNNNAAAASIHEETEQLPQHSGQPMFRPLLAPNEDPVLGALAILPWAITDAAFHCLVAMLPASSPVLTARFKLDLFVVAGRLLTGVDIDPVVALNVQLTAFSPLLLVVDASAPDLPATLTYEDIPVNDAIDAFGAAGVLSNIKRPGKIGRAPLPPRIFRFIRVGDSPLPAPTHIEAALAEETQARCAGLRTASDLYKTLAPRERASLGLRDATRVELLRGVETIAAIPLGAFLAAGSTVPAALISSTADVSALLPRPRPIGSPTFEAGLSSAGEALKVAAAYRRAAAAADLEELIASGSGTAETLARAYAAAAGTTVSPSALTASFASTSGRGEWVPHVHSISNDSRESLSSPQARIRILESLALASTSPQRRVLAPSHAASNFRSFLVRGSPVQSTASALHVTHNQNNHNNHNNTATIAAASHYISSGAETSGSMGGREDEMIGFYSDDPTQSQSWPEDHTSHAPSSSSSSKIQTNHHSLNRPTVVTTTGPFAVPDTLEQILNNLSGHTDAKFIIKSPISSPSTHPSPSIQQRGGPRLAAVLSSILPPPNTTIQAPTQLFSQNSPHLTIQTPGSSHVNTHNNASPMGFSPSTKVLSLTTTVARAAALVSLSPIDATRTLVNTSTRPSALRVPFLDNVPSSLLAYALGVNDANAQVVLGAEDSPTHVAAAVAARRRGAAFVASALHRTVSTSWAASGGVASFYAASAGGPTTSICSAVTDSQNGIDADARLIVARDVLAALEVQRELTANKVALAENTSRSAVAALGAEVTKERARRKAAALAQQSQRAALRATYGFAAVASATAKSTSKTSPSRRTETINLYTLAQMAISSGLYKGNSDDFAARKEEE